MGKELETSAGIAQRWAVYIGAALPRVLIGLEFSPQIQVSAAGTQTEVYRLVATAPGFDGWLLPLDTKYDALAQIVHGLEDWLQYRLANYLPIPRFPSVETPTLEDFEEYDAIRAYDRAKALQDLLAAEPPLPDFVRARQFALVSEQVLARDWLAPGEDEAWQHL